MRDVHCHIVFDVDDGSRTLEESLAMFDAARSAGITQIVATPHCRGSHFDRGRIIDHFACLKEAIAKAAPGFPITLGYEVYYNKLMEIGIEHAGDYRFEGTDDFLLELPTGEKPMELERTVFELQAMGLNLIIAHPERYSFVQEDVDIARDWAMGMCRLQLSGDFCEDSAFSRRRKVAKTLIKEGRVSFVASDAHCVDDYRAFVKACRIARVS